MRISDWSSDVCSSDLIRVPGSWRERPRRASVRSASRNPATGPAEPREDATNGRYRRNAQPVGKSEERGVGSELVSTCRSRWSPCHQKETHTIFTDSVRPSARKQSSREKKKINI